MTAGSWVTYNVTLNNVSSRTTNVYITDTFDFPVSLTVGSLSVPYSSESSWVTLTENGLVVYVDDVAVNQSVSLWYSVFVPFWAPESFSNHVVAMSAEGALAEICSELWVEPKKYEVFLPMVALMLVKSASKGPPSGGKQLTDKKQMRSYKTIWA